MVMRPFQINGETMNENYKKEITELHQFFQDWFRGDLPNTDTTFARFADTMHPEFIIIGVSGRAFEKQIIVSDLRNAHGSNPNITIWIENIQLRYQDDRICLATYEEWQKDNDQTTARLSTVTFLKDETALNNLTWYHLHETWKVRD
jgi:hypothetical protein